MKTAVEYLAERYDYIIWMRIRDEISEVTAVEWREKFLEKAKKLEKEQIINAYKEGCFDSILDESTDEERAEQYYSETYGDDK
jgi:HEPN domain-containing protein